MFTVATYSSIFIAIGYYLLPKIGLKVKSNYLRISLAWFCTTYVGTFVCYFLAILYSFFTTGVLAKATISTLILAEVLLLYLFFKYKISFTKLRAVRISVKPLDVLLVAICFVFSYLFFNPQLAMQNGKIYTSPIYWDFHWHDAVLQNFVQGDNFPPQDESFSGAPMTYHFFGDLVFSIYESLGLTLVQAMNYGSILALAFSLLALIGIGEEFFEAKGAGVIAAVLAVTTGSGHFSYYFSNFHGRNIFQAIGSVLIDSQHPWNASFIPGNPYGYQGIMFNLFYFLEERHMLFGIIYLLFCAYVIYKRSEIGNKMLFVLGLFMGAYFFWHIYISIMVLSALFFVLLFDKKRKKTGYLLIGYCLIFGGCFIYLKHILSNPLWFMTTGVRYPQLDLGFAAIGAKPGTLLAVKNMLQYYTFAYGLRGVMFFISIIILLKKDRRLLLVLLAFIVPTFILINTVKLSPNISENHKWLRPMDIIVDLTTAYIVYKGFFARRNYYIYSIGIICLFFLTISGIIELMPFLNSKPVKLYDAYPSSMSVAIQQYSTPKAVFVGKDNKEIHLAGRKMFVGASAGPDYALNKTYRETIIDNLYHTNDLQTFCHSIHDNNIDVVELDSQNIASLNLQKWFPFFTAQNSSNELVTFITTKQTCESL